jgi:tripartite-type tricarboxylate transporter receptor subunit TctC
MVSRRKTLGLAVSAACLAASHTAFAQAYPRGPIKLVVPYAPGGSTDLLARTLGEYVGKRLGQPVVVVNQPGAGGSLGTAAVARSAPDGLTLLMATNGTHAINPTLYAKLPYDAVKDFEPVSLVAVVPLLLAVPASSEIRTVKQFVERAAGAKRLSFGSAGVGSSGHLAGEMLSTEGNLQAVHIPYRGDGPAVVDLISGNIDFLFANMPAVVNHVRAGTVRAVAVTSAHRSPELPDVPTVAEAGYPRLQVDPWYGIFAPAGTPRAIVATLNEAIAAGLADAPTRKRFESVGATPQGAAPDKFAQLIASDTARFAAVIKASGARAE